MKQSAPGAVSQSLALRRVPASADWDACLATQSGATAFHRWDWLRTMAVGLGNCFLPLGLYQGDRLTGLAPLLVKRHGPYANVNWVPFPYLGMLAPRALQSAALAALDDYQRHNGIGLVQLGFAPHAEVDITLLRAYGYTVLMETTMVVPLAGQSEAALFGRLSAKRRRQIRHAQRAGVTTRPATEAEIRHDLPAMTRAVFARQELAPSYPDGAAGLLWARYHADPSTRWTSACHEGAPIAISVSLSDGRRAYSWQVSTLQRYRHLHASALLYWEDICWALGQGRETFDLVGNPNPGIADYKRQFHGQELPYPVATRVNRRWAAWGRYCIGSMRRHVHAWAPLLDRLNGDHHRGLTTLARTDG